MRCVGDTYVHSASFEFLDLDSLKSMHGNRWSIVTKDNISLRDAVYSDPYFADFYEDDSMFDLYESFSGQLVVGFSRGFMSISSPDRGFVENLDYIELYHKKKSLAFG